MNKILIIRLSSIGDIVLTTSLIRCMKQQRPELEIHFLCKKSFLPTLENNPYIHKLHVWDRSSKECLTRLKHEDFDHIVDLHKNLRSFRIKLFLRKKSTSFPKLNFEKWWYVRTKRDVLPPIHVVDRYFEAVKELGVMNDKQGSDYFIQESDYVDVSAITQGKFVALVCGGAHETKQLPIDRVAYLSKNIEGSVVLIGSSDDRDKVAFIEEEFPGKVYNACGKYRLNQTVSIVQQASLLITPDTGLMHIGAALKKRMITIWGSTVPQFGMAAYLPSCPDLASVFQVLNLKCRPCSKIGYKSCPKGHFLCMQKMDWVEIAALANTIVGKSI